MSRRILIVDPTPTNRIALKATLSGARYDVVAVASGAEALESVRQQAPDAILVDTALPDMNGSVFFARAMAAMGEAMPPVIALLDDAAPQTRIEAIRCGAATCLARPVERAWLLTNLRALLRRHETRSELRRRSVTANRLGFAETGAGIGNVARISLISDDRNHALSLVRNLRSQTLHRIEIQTPEQALDAADDPSRAPELCILCLGEQADENLSLMAELRARRDTRRAAILVEFDPADRASGVRALDQGASDLIQSDATNEERLLKIDRNLRLKRQDDKLRASLDASLMMAAHDPLTGLYNRRYAMRYLDDLSAQVREAGRGFGLLVLDVDYFKAVNDTYGHPAGDAVLKQVADRLRENLREGDLLARIGGEEFLVALPDCAGDEAHIAADRLRVFVSDTPFSLTDGHTIDVSVSIGAICGSGPPEELLSRADAALYVAKRNGRNRVESAESCHLPRRRGTATASDAPPADHSQRSDGGERFLN